MYLIPGVGLFDGPTAGGTFLFPGGLVTVPSDSSDTSLSVTSQALALTTYTASLALDVSITTTSQALVITTSAAGVALDVSLAVTSQSLSLTSYAATVAFGTDLAVATQALALTTYPASLTYDVNLTATVDALLMTTYTVSIQSGAVADIPVSVFLSGASDGLVVKDGGGIVISGSGAAAVGIR